MPTAIMSFESADPIGRVMSVDTMRVFIDVRDHELLKKVMVGNLIAVQGATGHQFLISIVERITRLSSLANRVFISSSVRAFGVGNNVSLMPPISHFWLHLSSA